MPPAALVETAWKHDLLVLEACESHVCVDFRPSG
jgi:hypothetical protein